MLEISLLCFLLMLTCGFIAFFLISIYPAINQTKTRAVQNNMALKLLYKSMEEQEKSLGSVIQLISELEKKNAIPGMVKDNLEHQYERAKRILKNGIMEEKDLLDSCNITMEEMELLSGLITNPEKSEAI